MDIPRADRFKYNNIPRAFSNKLVEYVVKECIATIQLHTPRNGVNSPENLQAKKHAKLIADSFGIELPLKDGPWYDIFYWIDHGGYEEASLDDPEFLEMQAKRDAK